MIHATTNSSGQVNLQATISASTSATYEEVDIVRPHHPITCCNGGLYFDYEGEMSCDHAKAPPNNPRTQSALNHSLAILLLELAFEKL